MYVYLSIYIKLYYVHLFICIILLNNNPKTCFVYILTDTKALKSNLNEKSVFLHFQFDT